MSKIFEKTLENPAAVWYNKDAVNESDCLKGEIPMNRQSNSKITALYERLSHDDEQRQGDSNSIQNQKKMLEDYAIKQGFTNICHYTDDGWSGTRFDRPGFVKMMDDIETGSVGIVLCKDTSRLGRDHIRVGLFMDADVKHKLKKYKKYLQKLHKDPSIKEKQANGINPSACFSFMAL